MYMMKVKAERSQLLYRPPLFLSKRTKQIKTQVSISHVKLVNKQQPTTPMFGLVNCQIKLFINVQVQM